MRQLCVVSALAALLLTACRPEALPQIGSRIDQVVQFYVDNNEFTGSVLVAKGADVVLSKSYGLANREWNVPNTPSTKFRIGSVTKQFTAAGILLLEEQGKLKTDDLLKTHWPETPRAWDKVTIFHLLTHTSGIPSVTDAPEFSTWQLSESSPEQTMAHVRDKALQFEPGSEYRYSNSGYVLLGLLIERLSGQSYADFMRERIFAPLGMNDSGLDSNTAVIERRASGYTPDSDNVLNADYVNMTFPHGAGALYSTTEDLLKWTRGLFEGNLLSAASLKKMTTPFKDGYAFGLGVVHQEGKTMFAHSGGIQGFNTNLSYFPGEKITIAVLSNLNGDAPDAIAGKLSALMNGEAIVLPSERKEVQLTEADLLKFVGLYELAPDTNLIVEQTNGHLTARIHGEPAKQFFAESAKRFFARDVDSQLEFEQKETGPATAVVLHLDGNEHHAKRVVDRVELTLTADALGRYAGTYQMEDGPVVISVDEGHLVLESANAPRVQLYAQAEDRFFMKAANVEIDFRKNQAGQVTGLVLRQAGKDYPGLRR
jgi:CubicO group peptidase (beta-lactamase class C family)